MIYSPMRINYELLELLVSLYMYGKTCVIRILSKRQTIGFQAQVSLNDHFTHSSFSIVILKNVFATNDI